MKHYRKNLKIKIKNRLIISNGSEVGASESPNSIKK